MCPAEEVSYLPGNESFSAERFWSRICILPEARRMIQMWAVRCLIAWVCAYVLSTVSPVGFPYKSTTSKNSMDTSEKCLIRQRPGVSSPRPGFYCLYGNKTDLIKAGFQYSINVIMRQVCCINTDRISLFLSKRPIYPTKLYFCVGHFTKKRVYYYRGCWLVK